MDWVCTVMNLGTCLWNTCACASHSAYITHGKETVNSLKTKMEELKAISDDVKMKVLLAEEQGMMRSRHVHSWLRRVQDTENKVIEILQEDEQISCLRKCDCRSAYKLGKKATETLDIVRELIKSIGGFPAVATQQPLPTSMAKTEGYCEMPMEKIAGTIIKSKMEEVWECLKDDKKGIIGLYGMGGVGKTTLLKTINNELPKRRENVFDAAIWVQASNQATLEAIQKDILEKLRIPSESWRSKPLDVRAALIHDKLKVKRYILMLDDVWGRLDLSAIGIPLPDSQNKCKIIFTTRSEGICGHMESHQNIRIYSLPWKEAWSLFQQKVGPATLSSHNDIPMLAEMVAKECDGLPLALIIVGRAMASRKTPYEWSHALQVLKKYPSKFSGMDEHVLPVLKLSYDMLPDPIIKECFVYCSLFPEDYEISSYKLVHLWIAEGLLKEFDDISEAHNHGFYIIESLKHACLLENASTSSHLRVKMHDVIRDMALRIDSDYAQRNKKFLTLKETVIGS